MKSILKASCMMLALALAFSNSTFASEGGETFKTKCSACHGPTGTGDTTMGKNLKLRDLGSADVQKQTDEELTTIITAGKGKMPKYGEKLSKEQVGELVKFIRTLKK